MTPANCPCGLTHRWYGSPRTYSLTKAGHLLLATLRAEEKRKGKA